MKKIVATELKNNFDSLMAILTPFVDSVEVSEPVGDDESEVVKTYEVAEWKKGIHRVGSGFYGYSDLIELVAKRKYNEHGYCLGYMFDSLHTIQLRLIVSNGYGRMYCNKPIGHVIVEVCANNRWTDYDMTKDADKVAFADYMNSLIK